MIKYIHTYFLAFSLVFLCFVQNSNAQNSGLQIKPKNLMFDTSCQGTDRLAAVEFLRATGKPNFIIDSVTLKSKVTAFSHAFSGPQTVVPGTPFQFNFKADASNLGTYVDTLLIYHQSTGDTASPIKMPIRIIVFPTPKSDFTQDKKYEQCLKENLFSFTNKATISAGTLKYLWDFGDGTTDTSKNPSHKYKTAAEFVPSLTAISVQSGCQANVPDFVTVYPVADFKLSINDSTQCLNNNEFIFQDFSTIKTGTITGKAWVLGDGKIESTNPDSFNYVYKKDSAYFNVMLISTSNEGCTDTGYLRAYVFPVPDANFVVNDSDQCVNADSYVFTNNSTIKYGNMSSYWNFGDNDTSTKTNPTKSYNSPSFKTVTLIMKSDSGCLDTTKSTVYVHYIPVVSFKASDSILCITGNSVAFENNSVIGSLDTLTYIWDFGDATYSPNEEPSHSYSAVGKYRPMLIVNTSKGCTDSLWGDSILIKPSPAAKITVNQNEQCFNAHNFVFTNGSSITSGSITNYQWFFGNGDSSKTNNPSYNSYANTDTFIIKLGIISDLGCKDTAVTTVVTLPEPVVTMVVDKTNSCFLNNNFQFKDNTILEYGTINHTWDFGDNTVANTPDANKKYDVFAPSFNVKHLVQTNKGCKDSAFVTILLDKGPTANFSINDNTQCLRGNTFNFTNNSTPAGVNNKWTFGDGDSSANLNSVHTYNSFGKYTVLQTTYDNTSKCADTMSKSIEVFEHPRTFFNINPKNQCIDQNNYTFTNRTGEPTGTASVDYIWDFGDGIGTSTAKDTNYIYLATDLVRVSLIATTAEGCDSIYYDSAFIRPMPVASYNVNDQDQCLKGNEFIFTNTSTIEYGNMRYEWRLGDGNTSTDANTTNVYTDGSDSSYISMVAISDYGCSDTVYDFVYVFDNPSANFSINNSAQCIANNAFEFSDASGLPSGTLTANYSYDLGDGNTYNTTNNNDTLFHSYLNSDTFNVLLIVTTAEGCNDSIYKPIYVFPSPTASFTINDTAQCRTQNEFILISTSTVTDPNSSLSNYWILGDLNEKPAGDTLIHVYNRKFGGLATYTIWLYVTTKENCIDSISHDVTVTPSPTAKFSGLDKQFCIGNSSVTLVPLIAGGTFESDQNNVTGDQFTPSVAGWNRITYGIDVDGCADTLTDSTLVVVPLNFDLGPDTLICKDDIVPFDISVEGATYLWSNGETTGKTYFASSGIHYVTATNACGSVTDNFKIEAVDIFCDAFIPNAFTPDGNYTNDHFFPIIDTVLVKDMEFIVFNRWGNVVYRSTNPTDIGWDGKFNGALSPQDVYGWYLRMGLVRNDIRNIRTEKGNVTLLR